MEKGFMNLLKKICIFSLCFATVCCYSMPDKICVNSTTNYQMFGSVRWSDYLSASFIMAFQDENFSNFIIKSATTESQLSRQVSKMTKSQCPVMLGLFTSQDCLITGNIFKKNKAIALSSSCSNESINQFYPYVYSMTPKQSDYSKAVANYISKNNKEVVVYAFYQPSDIYSRDGFKYFRQHVKKKIIPISVRTNGSFDLSKFENIKDKEVYYVFFTYPLPSVQIISKIDADNLVNKHSVIIGASSWLYQLSVFHSIKPILEKSSNLLAPNLVNKNKVEHSLFNLNFEKKFHRKPDVVEILTYDATRLSVKCYWYAKRFQDFKEGFLKCLHDGAHDGISGEINFKKDSPFAQRRIYLDSVLDRL